MHRMTDGPLILASASPQRQRLLEGLGVEFVVIPSKVDEEACEIRNHVERALTLSRLKAEEVAERHRGRWVIGCDTLVEGHEGSVLEKSANEEEAAEMLRLQSGSTSIVHSGLTVLTPTGEMHQGVSSSAVTFRPLSEADIAWWVAAGLWSDRSGSFQIDGPGQLMIERIDGDWSSVVGLPVFLLGQLMREAGSPYPQFGV